MAKTIKKLNKKREHVTYNKKVFLAPESINSMAAIFTKIYKDGTAIIRISDCNNTIKLWNDLNERKQVDEMLTKIDSLREMLWEFRREVQYKKPAL